MCGNHTALSLSWGEQKGKEVLVQRVWGHEWAVSGPAYFLVLAVERVVWGSGLCFQTSHLHFSEASRGPPQPKDSLPVPRHFCGSLASLRGLMPPPGGRNGLTHPGNLGEAGRRRRGFCGRVPRGDVMTGRRFSPPLLSPTRSCQYLTWRHHRLPLLCVRVCVRRRWRRGLVGARRCCSCCSCRGRSCPAGLDCRADEALATALWHRTQLRAAPAGGWANACRRAPRARAGGRP